MKLAVIIPVYNRRETTLSCLRQLEKCLAGICYSFIVIDDGSTDGTSEAVHNYSSDIMLLHGNGNLWWTGAVEMGRVYAIKQNFTHLLIVNDDLEFEKDFFLPIIEVCRKYSDALIGAVKVDASDHQTILCSGYLVKGNCLHFIDPYAGRKTSNSEDEIVKVDALAGAVLLIPVHAAEAIGPFSVHDFPHNFGDLEYTYRASKLGYPCYTASRSRTYTIPNPNYLRTHLFATTRMQFVKNLFERYKLGYGFVPTFKRAFMGKSFLLGSYCLLRAYASLGLKIFYKLFIWNTVFDKKKK